MLDRGLLLSGVAPAVVSRADRAEYLELISTVDYDGMARFLRESSEREVARLEAFRLSRKGPRSGI